MPMYLCSWAERSTMLLERADEASAKKDATEAAEGDVPSRVRRFPPNVFVAEVAFDADEGEDATVDDLVVEPMPHIAELLFELEPDDVDVEAATEPPRLLTTKCSAEAYDADDKVVRCSLKHAHDGEHESSGGLVWK